MTLDIGLWILGAGLLPLIAWGVSVTYMIKRTQKDTYDLLKMHRNPDAFGFGTEKTNQIIEDNTRAMQALVHYIKWFVKDQTGKEPPPPMGEI